MKSKKPFFLIFTVLVSWSLFSSCQHMATATGGLARVAGGLGLINPNVATAISQSAEAIGRAAETITPEQEYYIGRAVAANILTTYRIWNGNPALTAYLNRICMAIVINSPRPEIFNGYRVNILETDEINAFATSGGHIFLTGGLIAYADSEDALAGVIAHEIAHIQLMHSIKAIRNSRITQALLVTGVSAGGAAAGMNVAQLTDVFNETVGEIVTTLVSNGYSRNQEFEADDTALSLMASAGYDPQGLITMLRLLESNHQDSRGFGRTHPPPADRIANVQKSIGNYRAVDTNSSAYRQRLARFNAHVW